MLYIKTIILFLLLTSSMFAANCGGSTVCQCGDTVTSNYTATADLICPYAQTPNIYPLNIAGVSVDFGGHQISGQNSYPIGPYYGVPDISPYQDSTCVAMNVDGGSLTNVVLTGCFEAVHMQGVGNSLTYATINNAGQIGVTIAGINQIVSHCTFKSVFGYPILIQANSSTVTFNLFDSNRSNIETTNGSVIHLNGQITGITLTDNIATNNSGYFINNSNTVTSTGSFSRNVISNQKTGVFDISPSGTPGPLLFDTTNTIDGGKIYILSGISGVYDGNSLGTLGTFYCTGCSNLTLRNAVFKDRIWLKNTNTFTINNVTFNNYSAAAPPIMVDNTSTGGVISNNTITSAGTNGSIYVASNNTSVTGNTLTDTAGGIIIASGTTGVSVSNNTLIRGHSSNLVIGSAGASVTSNTIKYPLLFSSMIGWTEITRIGSISSPINFTFSMKTSNETTACSACSYSAVVYPTTNVTTSVSANIVSGSFTPTTNGTYSLLITVTDLFGNTTTRNFLFLIGPTSSITTRYYQRYGQSFSNIGGAGMDAQPMTLLPPIVNELAGYCSGWIQHSPNTFPDYPVSIFTQYSGNLTYQMSSGTGTLAPYIGLTRMTDYSTTVDSSHFILSETGKFTNLTVSPSLSGLNWTMDIPQSWTIFSVKLVAPSIKYPQIFSTAAAGSPSYADLTYLHTTIGAIKSISSNLIILSADATHLNVDILYGTTITISIPGLSSGTVYVMNVDGFPKGVAVVDNFGVANFTHPASLGIHALNLVSLSKGNFIF
jgi:hypothetical protein